MLFYIVLIYSIFLLFNIFIVKIISLVFESMCERHARHLMKLTDAISLVHTAATGGEQSEKKPMQK